MNLETFLWMLAYSFISFHFGNENIKGKHILLTSKRYKLKLFYSCQCLKYVNISQEIFSKKTSVWKVQDLFIFSKKHQEERKKNRLKSGMRSKAKWKVNLPSQNFCFVMFVKC